MTQIDKTDLPDLVRRDLIESVRQLEARGREASRALLNLVKAEVPGRRARRKAPRPPDGLRTPAEAAARLATTVEQVFAFVRDGELHYVNVGRGKKRPRYRFADGDIDELIEKRKEQAVQCPSTNPKSQRLISGSTSKSVVVGFMDRRAAQIAAKRKR